MESYISSVGVKRQDLAQCLQLSKGQMQGTLVVLRDYPDLAELLEPGHYSLRHVFAIGIMRWAAEHKLSLAPVTGLMKVLMSNKDDVSGISRCIQDIYANPLYEPYLLFREDGPCLFLSEAPATIRGTVHLLALRPLLVTLTKQSGVFSVPTCGTGFVEPPCVVVLSEKERTLLQLIAQHKSQLVKVFEVVCKEGEIEAIQHSFSLNSAEKNSRLFAEEQQKADTTEASVLYKEGRVFAYVVKKKIQFPG
jgi:hypothetical protein